jgi:hypothetical protein
MFKKANAFWMILKECTFAVNCCVCEMSLKLARLKRFFLLVVVFGVIGGINLWGIGALLSLKSIRGKTLSGQLLYQPLE